MNEKKLYEWNFNFGLYTNNSSDLIPDSKCEELFDIIIAWAEANNLSLGGGYGEFKKDDE